MVVQRHYGAAITFGTGQIDKKLVDEFGKIRGKKVLIQGHYGAAKRFGIE